MEMNRDLDPFEQQCKRTYEAHLPELMERHGGKCVAISGEQILGVGSDVYELIKKYTAPGTPPVVTFSIPRKEDRVGDIGDLTIPHGILP